MPSYSHNTLFWTWLAINVKWPVTNWTKSTIWVEKEWKWTSSFKGCEINTREISVTAGIVINKSYRKKIYVKNCF